MTIAIDAASEEEVARDNAECMGSLRIAEAALTSLGKRGVNRMIHEILTTSSETDLVGFFCECSDADCCRVVWLTGDAFERGRADPSWHLLASGHRAAGSDVPER